MKQLQKSDSIDYMDNKLFVGNLAWETNEDDLKQHFSQFGNVDSAEVMRDKFTGRARGFGFVVMSTPEEAQLAIEKTEGVEFMGRPLKVNIARPREDTPPERRSFGGSRGGFAPRRREGGFSPRREGGFDGGRRFGAPRDGGFKKRPFGNRRPGGFRKGPRTFDAGGEV